MCGSTEIKRSFISPSVDTSSMCGSTEIK
jgi:hypothetical protein